MAQEIQHIPVLLKETIEPFLKSKGKLFVDGTLGGGGHLSYLLANRKDACVIGIDQDKEVISRLGKVFSQEIVDKRLRLYHRNFSEIGYILSENSLSGIDGIILDLGFSSIQMDTAERGLSFMKDGPLDMRLNQEASLTAADIINNWDAKDLLRLFFEYGEEKNAKIIVRGIIKYRSQQPITRTRELATLIENSIPFKLRKKSKIHPATRVFQALRIHINQELDVLKNLLEQIPALLNPGGILAIISFHSLEDRIVKQRFKFLSDMCICPPAILTCERCNKPPGHLFTKKAIIPSEEEIESNPRARSAKLRIFVRN